MSNSVGYLAELFASIQGEGPWVGHRQIFLRLAGCRETCAYCDTPQSRASRPKTWHVHLPNLAAPVVMHNPVLPAEIVPLLWNLQLTSGPFHSLALTGGEPLEQEVFLNALSKELARQKWRLPLFLETNGLLAPAMKKMRSHIDFVSADIKLASATGTPTAWNRHELFLKAAKTLPGAIKLVLVPKTSSVEIVQAARLAQRIVPKWDLILQPATGINWKLKTHQHRLNSFIQAAGQIHSRVRLIPQIHPILGLL